jgi:hypothetical protein
MLHQQFERRAQYVVACGRGLFLPQGGFVRCHDSTLPQMSEYANRRVKTKQFFSAIGIGPD